MFPGDLVVVENPWEKDKLLVRRVTNISVSDSCPNKCSIWVASETLNGGIDSKVFGPIPMQSVLGRACYYFNNDQNHGPIMNNQLAHIQDQIYVSHAQSFFM